MILTPIRTFSPIVKESLNDMGKQAFDDELHFSEDAMEEYAMGRFSAEDAAQFDQHLLACPDCRRELKEVQDYIRLMKGAGSEANKEDREF